jgi:LmbE family N-acetylglucosaminyl deacetylase
MLPSHSGHPTRPARAAVPPIVAATCCCARSVPEILAVPREFSGTGSRERCIDSGQKTLHVKACCVGPSIVIVSPHLDDAVLSLGGLISRETAAGSAVEVVSCFTTGPPPDTIVPARRALANYAIRRAEDERALAVLGASHHSLDLRERIWREPRLSRPLQVFRTPAHIEDFAELESIRRAIALALDRSDVVYAPLAVGHHVDHFEVALAALCEVLDGRAFARRASTRTRTRWRGRAGAGTSSLGAACGGGSAHRRGRAPASAHSCSWSGSLRAVPGSRTTCQ